MFKLDEPEKFLEVLKFKKEVEKNVIRIVLTLEQAQSLEAGKLALETKIAKNANIFNNHLR